jgi:hypothetical protein
MPWDYSDTHNPLTGEQRPPIYRPDAPRFAPVIKVPNATFLCPKCGRNILYRRGQFFNWLSIGCGERDCPAKKAMKQDNRLYRRIYLTFFVLLGLGGLFLYSIDWKKVMEESRQPVTSSNILSTPPIQTVVPPVSAPPRVAQQPPKTRCELLPSGPHLVPNDGRMADDSKCRALLSRTGR